MIKADKNILFEKGFDLYLRPLIRFSFSNLFGRHLAKPASPAVLFIANHSSWWDGLLFFFLNKTIWRHDIHMMMLEDGLERYRYFRWLGAFSINRQKPKEIIVSLQYAEQLLQSGKSVVLFPQGDEYHLETRPLQFQTGIGYLAERCPDIPIIPISFYYSFRHERKPEVWIQQGHPVLSTHFTGTTRKEKTLFLQDLCTVQLDHLKEQALAENTEAFQELSKRRK